MAKPEAVFCDGQHAPSAARALLAAGLPPESELGEMAREFVNHEYVKSKEK